MVEIQQTCPRCQEEDSLRQRNFSDQALAALIIWEEVDDHQVNQPICASCYEELREVLIERAGELEDAAKQPRNGPRSVAPRPAAAGLKMTRLVDRPTPRAAPPVKTAAPAKPVSAVKAAPQSKPAAAAKTVPPVKGKPPVKSAAKKKTEEKSKPIKKKKGTKAS